MTRRNKNRGYQQLVVWQDAIDYYKLTTENFRPAGFEMGRIVSQQLASVDSLIVEESNATYNQTNQ